MKNISKRIRLCFIVCAVFLTACNSVNHEENTSGEEDPVIDQEVTERESDNEESRDSTVDNEATGANEDENINTETDNAENTKIKLTFNNEEVIVNMDDNPTSNDFLELLPLILTFEDYAGTEKISYPPSELSKEGAPSGIEPAAGDFTYYAPWGNLAIFYEDFRHSNGLIKLGEFESGIEKLLVLDGDFEMVIELIE